MLRSMTGFGRAERETPQGRLVAEIRAVNARFTEVRVRLPAEALGLEMRLRDRLRGALARGKVDCTVRLEPAGEVIPTTVDPAAIQATFHALHRACVGLPLAEGVTLEAVLRAMPREDRAGTLWSDEAFGAEVEAAVGAALEALTAAREAEGQGLAAVLAQLIGQIEAAAETVRAQAPQVAAQCEARLRQRAEELAAGQALAIDAGRLEQEVIFHALRLDLTEELDRLAVHCRAFRDLLDASEPVGRRMDFLVQEILREVNTVGAKAKDAGITGLVVDLKVLVEQVREQIQNVE